MDSASLMVALLRSSEVPARYHYGRVWMPVAAVQNWLGVDVPAAAQLLLAQGGIPSQQIKINGQLQYIALEHVWVEYWAEGVWQQVDPSFKQYRRKEGIKLIDAVPFPLQELIPALGNGAAQ